MREGEREGEIWAWARAVNRPLWMEWLCAAAFSSFPPLCRHRMDEPRRRNQSWSATRARTHLSVRFERPSKQLREGRFHFPTTGKSTQTTKSEVAPTWERAFPFRDDRSLTADLSMVESHFYAAAAAIACRTRALYPISVAHVRMNMRTKEGEGVC